MRVCGCHGVSVLVGFVDLGKKGGGLGTSAQELNRSTWLLCTIGGSYWPVNLPFGSR